MATQENPQLPNAAELTPQQIADEIAAQQVGGESASDPQREYVFETQTGSVFRGKTKQEVIDKMLKSTDHANTLIKQQRDELDQLKAQFVEQPQVEPQQPVQSQGVDWNHYYQLWAQNVNAAEDYRLQATFGVTQQQVLENLSRAYEFANRLEPHVVAQNWMASVPSYPNFERAAPEEAEKAATAIGNLWNEFYPNEPVETAMSPQKLEQLHAVALMRGLYQSATPAPVVQSPAQSSPMPTLNTGISEATGEQQQIVNMTPEKLRAFIEQNYR